MLRIITATLLVIHTLLAPLSALAAGHGALPSGGGRIQLNMYSPGDNAQMPFLNIAKQAQFYSWKISGTFYGCQNAPGKANNAWDTGDVDSECALLPNVSGAQALNINFWTAQPSEFLTVRAGFTHAGQHWVVKWDGDSSGVGITASILSGCASAQSFTPGTPRMTFTWGSNMGATCTFEIDNFDITNPPHNIRIVYAPYESRLDNGEIFDPDFLRAVIAGSQTIRMQQWMDTIVGLSNTSFAAIPDEGYWTWANDGTIPSIRGTVPLSVMIKLANQTKKNLWLSINLNYGLSPKAALSTSVTAANPGVVTAPGNNFANGDVIVEIECFGYAGHLFTVANVGAYGTGTFDLSTDTTSFGAAGQCAFMSEYSTTSATAQAELLGAYVRDNLDPSLIAYYEYSNEIWNPCCLNRKYIASQGTATGSGNSTTGIMGASLMYGIYQAYGAGGRSRWKGVMGGCTACGVGGFDFDFPAASTWITANSSLTLTDIYNYGDLDNYWGDFYQGDLTGSATVTQASPAVLTDPLGAMQEGAPVQFASSGGGITAGTTYYFVNVNNSTHQGNLSLTSTLQGGGTPLINTTSGLVSPNSMTWIIGTTFANMAITSAAAWRAGTTGTRWQQFNSMVNQDAYNGKYTGVPNPVTVGILPGLVATSTCFSCPIQYWTCVLRGWEYRKS